MAGGTLPSFSWISPSSQASDHPCNDIRKGERQLKDIYEAVRASPKWNKTLMLVVYDDFGGAYDHVIPPAEWRHHDHMGQPREGRAVPSDDAPCHLLDQCSSSQPYLRRGIYMHYVDLESGSLCVNDDLYTYSPEQVLELHQPWSAGDFLPDITLGREGRRHSGAEWSHKYVAIRALIHPSNNPQPLQPQHVPDEAR